MWQDYLTEFSGILPRVVARLDPETPYWPSSPSADYETSWASTEAISAGVSFEKLFEGFKTGDMHDWSVWHGRVPFASSRSCIFYMELAARRRSLAPVR